MRHAANPEHHPVLDRQKVKLENDLRSRFGSLDRAELKAIPIVEAYNSYYKRFKKTYNVLLITPEAEVELMEVYGTD